MSDDDEFQKPDLQVLVHLMAFIHLVMYNFWLHHFHFWWFPFIYIFFTHTQMQKSKINEMTSIHTPRHQSLGRNAVYGTTWITTPEIRWQIGFCWVPNLFNLLGPYITPFFKLKTHSSISPWIPQTGSHTFILWISASLLMELSRCSAGDNGSLLEEKRTNLQRGGGTSRRVVTLELSSDRWAEDTFPPPLIKPVCVWGTSRHGGRRQAWLRWWSTRHRDVQRRVY